MSRRIPRLSDAELVDRYLGQGQSQARIAAEVGVDRSTVGAWLRGGGIPTRRRGARPVISAERWQHLIDDYEGGASLHALAGEHGISHTTVQRYLLAAGVTLRPAGGSSPQLSAGRRERLAERRQRLAAAYTEGASIRALARAAAPQLRHGAHPPTRRRRHPAPPQTGAAMTVDGYRAPGTDTPPVPTEVVRRIARARRVCQVVREAYLLERARPGRASTPLLRVVADATRALAAAYAEAAVFCEPDSVWHSLILDAAAWSDWVARQHHNTTDKQQHRARAAAAAMTDAALCEQDTRCSAAAPDTPCGDRACPRPAQWVWHRRGTDDGQPLCTGHTAARIRRLLEVA